MGRACGLCSRLPVRIPYRLETRPRPASQPKNHPSWRHRQSSLVAISAFVRVHDQHRATLRRQRGFHVLETEPPSIKPLLEYGTAVVRVRIAYPGGAYQA